MVFIIEWMRHRFGCWEILALWLFAFGTAGSAVASNSVTLAWDPSPGLNIQGYTIYYGFGAGVYNAYVYVGNVTNATISNLVAETTYYFAATATDTSGLESEYSNEVSYTVPTNTFGLSIQAFTPGQVVVSSKNREPGARFDILASPDPTLPLTNWSSVGQATAGVDGVFWFTNSATDAVVFYRALSAP